MCYSLEEMKSPPPPLPNMNKLFKGIMFNQEDKIHECIVIISGKENNGKLWQSFSLIFAGFRKGVNAEDLIYRRDGMTDSMMKQRVKY